MPFGRVPSLASKVEQSRSCRPAGSMACFFQPREERRVCGSRQALVQDTYQPDPVFGKQGFRIEPEAGENLRAIDAVGTRRQVLKVIVAADEPVDQVGVELHNDIFLHPSPLVIGLLLPRSKARLERAISMISSGAPARIAFRVVPRSVPPTRERCEADNPAEAPLVDRA